MIPLRDENPTTHVPFVTLALVALNILAFVVWQPTFGTEDEQQTFFFCHAEIPFEVTHQQSLGEPDPDAIDAIREQFDVSSEDARDFQEGFRRECGEKTWWQSIFVAMFLHGSWLHIAGNMLFLWVFGNNVEDKLRPIPYFLFYIGAGLAAAAAQTAVSVNSVIPSLGASGAIAGVLGAYILMFPRRRVLTLVMFFFITVVYLPAFVVLGLWFVLQLISGLVNMTEQINAGGGIAFFAHIGGFVFGAALAALFFPKERIGARPPPPRPDMFGRRRWTGGRRQAPPGSPW